jgi:hypothetical protein
VGYFFFQVVKFEIELDLPFMVPYFVNKFKYLLKCLWGTQLVEWKQKTTHYFSANQGYNYRVEEVIMSEIKLDLPFMVPEFNI